VSRFRLTFEACVDRLNDADKYGQILAHERLVETSLGIIDGRGQVRRSREGKVDVKAGGFRSEGAFYTVPASRPATA
jgi:hypothetical protein